MKGKRVIVTGGGRGIGWAIAQQFLAANARVAIFDLQIPAEAAEQTLALEVDVSDSAAVNAATQRVADELGGVEILVNSAGINRDKISWKLTDEQWDQVIDVDLKGCFTTARAAIPLMRKASWGRIVDISSINGLRGKFGQANYSAAKAGVVGLSKALARELGHFGITVNVICPGLVMTDMVKAAPPEIVTKATEEMVLKAPPEPADVAHAVFFLASDAARCITGEVIRVDSGQYI